MEEDIKILEKWIKKESMNLKINTAIENLINRNKELEEENIHWKGQYHLLSRKINVIPKSKVRELLEKLKDKEKELTDEQGYWGGSELQNKIEILQELLGDDN